MDEDEKAIGTHQTNYTYDQLNRIKTMNGFNREGSSVEASGYTSEYSYDKNGNLEKLKRTAWSGDATNPEKPMDDFTYHYATDGNGKKLNNKLLVVGDAQGKQFDEDLDDQLQQLIDLGFTTYNANDESTHNYQYDAIGQLVTDKTEEIEEIEWTVTNKVRAIKRYSWSDKPDLYFEYDAMGNRISKTVYPKNPQGEIKQDEIKTTYYILDAQACPENASEAGVIRWQFIAQNLKKLMRISKKIIILAKEIYSRLLIYYVLSHLKLYIGTRTNLSPEDETKEETNENAVSKYIRNYTRDFTRLQIELDG
jgi:hypothetical protein